jgi:ABC-type antimicrobial peptide transport system permease subunit
MADDYISARVALGCTSPGHCGRPPGAGLNEGRLYLNTAWWLTAFPGLAIFVTVLAVNLLGNHLRDWLDPRRRGP